MKVIEDPEYRVAGEDRWAPFRRYVSQRIKRAALWGFERIPWLVSAVIMFAVVMWFRTH